MRTLLLLLLAVGVSALRISEFVAATSQYVRKYDPPSFGRSASFSLRNDVYADTAAAGHLGTHKDSIIPLGKLVRSLLVKVIF